MKFGLGHLKSRSRGVFVAARDRCLDLLDEGAHAAHPGAINGCALGGLAYAFFRRFMTGHARSRCRGRAGLYRWGVGPSTWVAASLILLEHHRLRNEGARFSTKAAIPSLRS